MKTDLSIHPVSARRTKKRPRRGVQNKKPESGEVARAAFCAFALIAFGDVLDLSVFEQGLHLDFSAAGAIEAMSRTRGTGVLADLTHVISSAAADLSPKRRYFHNKCAGIRSRPGKG
ncbi:MAG: hypothetical protein NT080_12365 [Spirochaetes bacterium]|nr:hypothetical protein [Spirochaetota bacterium]